MRDFESVVRNVVGGLTDNTPEMRAKVYDKARKALGGQLASMSPKPAPASIRCEMQSLEAAITAVEAEHCGVVSRTPIEAQLHLRWNIESLPSQVVARRFLPASFGDDFLSNLGDIYLHDWLSVYGAARAKWMWHRECLRAVAEYWLHVGVAKACRLWTLIFR